jgi:hypothetical protein
LWVIFALLDPDPDSEYGSGSGSTGPIEYGSIWIRILFRIRIHNPENVYLSFSPILFGYFNIFSEKQCLNKSFPKMVYDVFVI